MKEIGGYFELELPHSSEYPHSYCFHLNSGRHALEFILRSIKQLPTRIWIPYYTCDSVLEPLSRLGISHEFYHINESFELPCLPQLRSDEMIIVNNYFGLQDNYTAKLTSYYGSQIIIDATQAWYAPEMLGIKMFYSPRKFFGLPDGGIAWTSIDREIKLEKDNSYNRCSHLLMRIDKSATFGYKEFHRNSEELSSLPLLEMSNLSKQILGSINHEEVKSVRRSNYSTLHDALKRINKYNAPDITQMACPMIYPFMTDNPNLRKYLIEKKIYIATYWPNVLKWCNKDSTEYSLSKNILPLPIDQRYGEKDMERIIKTILHGS